MIVTGIHTPSLYYVDLTANAIYMEHLEDAITLKQRINDLLEKDDQSAIISIAEEIGSNVAQLHKNGIIHGDLTTSNFLVRDSKQGGCPQLIMIDFGLTSIESAHNPEDKGTLSECDKLGLQGYL